ncbi:RNA-dependent RNA polymerase [Mycena kentingensis (nom. inval.)]|nr:RNA-dependent RNA polymerase [Mycena kentingensis (nom. inval.)]
MFAVVVLFLLAVSGASATPLLDQVIEQRQARTWTRVDMYQGQSFLDQWDFFAEHDPTNGMVNYQTKDNAVNKKLATVEGNVLTLAVDDFTQLPLNQYRDSVRISSKKKYSSGLFIADFSAMPASCGTWTVGPSWPHGGEIDVVEGTNVVNTNQITLHTDTNCTQPVANGAQTGNVLSTTCASSPENNGGCGVKDTNAASFGKAFNDAQGGVFAHEWIPSSGIRVWFFPRSSIPADIGDGTGNAAPNPDGWGTPVASYQTGTGGCDFSQRFKDHVLTIDTTLCGDWGKDADSLASSGCPITDCAKVLTDPNNFKAAKWKVNYIAVYDSSGGAADAPSRPKPSPRPSCPRRTTTMSQDDYSNFDLDFDALPPEALREVDATEERHSPTKKTATFRVPAVPTAPTTPTKHGLVKSNESPVKQGSPSTNLVLSQHMEGARLGSPEAEDSTDGVRRNLFSTLQQQKHEDGEASRRPAPRPVQKSDTVDTFISTASGDSFFAPSLSKASSASSIGSDAGPSCRKRSAEAQAVSPSPPKCPKLEVDPPPFDPVKILGNHGSLLPVHIIAHDDNAQQKFDRFGVPFGTQYMLALEQTKDKPRWTWADVNAKDLRDLNGSNAAHAAHVAAFMLGRPRRPPSQIEIALFMEFDRELEAFKDASTGGLRGLGLCDDKWGFSPDGPYHGGQITLGIRLKKTEHGFALVLCKPERGRSYRFARDRGSTSLLPLSIPIELIRDEEERERVIAFLAQRHVLLGRSYIAIAPKDADSLYLLEINMDSRRNASHKFWADGRMISYVEFLRRHNPPELNSGQSVSKWCARFALGCSTSRPALVFLKDNVFELKDELAEGANAQDPASEHVMTDGCGLMNRAAFISVKKAVGYQHLPVVVQGRFAGAKGTWLLHPDDTGSDHKIWIRGSQRKIKHHEEESGSRVNLILDLLRVSQPGQTDRRYELSEQSIVCLAANGVPALVLEQLHADGIKESLAPLLDWRRDDTSIVATLKLARAVEQLGSVANARARQFAGSESRVLGLGVRERSKLDEVEDELADNDGEDGGRAAESRDVAGGSRRLHEFTIELFQAGFHPSKCKYAYDKLKAVFKAKINDLCEKTRISLPESTAVDAFAVPDPTGLLKPGQVFYRASNAFRHPETLVEYHVLQGEVLIGRYPMRLPCDIQKVMAVDIPELHAYTDVLIASVQGDRSLLSILSGGDYDGDTVIITWLPQLVVNFQNKEFTPPPPNFIETFFERDVKTVESLFLDDLAPLGMAEAQLHFQKTILATGLVDSKVGLYSSFHDSAVFYYGYGSPQAILMAYLGNTLLDAGKSGLRLRAGVFEKHRREFGKRRPPLDDNAVHDFILHRLYRIAKAKGDVLLAEFEKLAKQHSSTFEQYFPDPVLGEPFKNAEAKVTKHEKSIPALAEQLDRLKQHVDDVYADYKAITDQRPDKRLDQKQRNKRMFAAQTKYRQPVVGQEGFVWDGETIGRVKASYACSKDERFGIEIAFRAVAEIKAKSMPGGAAAATTVFDMAKIISRTVVGALQADE